MNAIFRFAMASRQALDEAEKIAVSMGHSTMDTGHLLLALLRSVTKAYIVLECLGINEYDVKTELKAIRPPIGQFLINSEWDPEVHIAVEHAEKFCCIEMNNEIQPSHLLAGMLDMEDSIARQIICSLGYSPKLIIVESICKKNHFDNMPQG